MPIDPERPIGPGAVAPAPTATDTIAAPGLPGIGAAPIAIPGAAPPMPYDSTNFPGSIIETPQVPTTIIAAPPMAGPISPAPDIPYINLAPVPGEAAVLGREVLIRQPDVARSIILGKIRTRGIPRFIQTDQFKWEDEVKVNEGQFLHLVTCFSGHRVEAFDKLFIDGKEVQFGGTPPGAVSTDARWSTGFFVGSQSESLVFWSKSLGDEDQAVNADLLTQAQALFPTLVTADHRGRGISFLYMIMKFHYFVFQNGMPDIVAEIRGKNDIHDPRTHAQDGSGNPLEWGYTNNAALIIADYLQNKRYGLNADYATEINNQSIIDAADICDDSMTTAEGSESRYTINGKFSSSESPRQMLEHFKAAIGGGEIYTVGDRWHINPAKWAAPVQINSSDLVLDDNDLLSDLVCNTKPSRENSFNRVKGVYTSEKHDFQQVDFPAITNSLYLSQDSGEERWLNLPLRFVTSEYRSQRIGKIYLRRHRQSLLVQGDWSMKAYPLTVGDNVKLTNAVHGWTEKIFVVLDCEQIEIQGMGGNVPAVRMILKETASEIFDADANELQVDVAPNTTFPQPSDTDTPKGLKASTGTSELIRQADGTVISRVKLTWDEVKHPFVNIGGKIEIQFQKVGASEWEEWTPAEGNHTQTWITNVEDGARYNFRIRSKNAFGYVSDYIQLTGIEVLGKSEKPSDVASISANVGPFGIDISCSQISDLDLACYEFRYGIDSESPTWDTATRIECRATPDVRWPVQAAETYKLFVRAVDRTGNVSENDATTTVAIAGPQAPTGLQYEFDGEELIIDWDDADSVAQFQLFDYEIRYGATYGASTFVAFVDASVFRFKPNGWSGTRKYWITPRDIAKNLGTSGQLNITIATPTAVQNLTPKVVRHQLELKWSAPSTSSLPVKEYEIRKGADFDTAESRGRVTGTYTLLVESVASDPIDYFWVAPVDTAGNIGTEISIAAAIQSPPNFVLRLNQKIDLSGDLDSESNVVIQSEHDSIIGPVTHESWDDHFNTPVWDTIQDKIDAGYDGLMQPSNTSDGDAVFIVDVGGTVPAQTLITLEDTVNILKGSNASVVRDIAFGSSASGPWTEATSVRSLLATASFTHVRARYNLNSTDDTSLVEVLAPRVQLSVTEDEEVGTGTTSSGTDTYTIVKDFVEVTGVLVTAVGGSGDTRITHHNFDFVTQPSSFAVYIKDKDGNNVDDDYTVSVKGIISTA